jgi:diguanylate cyclase (GGDEF)-like protein
MIAVTGVSYVQIQSFKQHYYKSLEIQGLAVARNLAAQLGQLTQLGLSIDELIGFDQQCRNAVRSYDDVAYAMLVEKDGTPLFSHLASGVSPPATSKDLLNKLQGTEEAFSYGSAEKSNPVMLDVLVPFGDLSTNPPVVVRVGMHTANIAAKVHALRVNTLVTALLSIALMLWVLFVLLNIIIVQPLSRLHSALMNFNIISGQQISIETRDEIGNIAITFNKLSTALYQSQKKIQRYTHELEDQVRQRTSDLTYANQQLSDDIERRKITEERLEQLAYRDTLTDLPNRAYILRFLEQQIAEDISRQRPFSVLFIDIDRFKFVNDTFGHATGDELLFEIAARLRQVVRSGDIVGRLGGDEFIVLLLGVDSEAVSLHVAQAIIESLAPAITLHDFSFTATASIGISLYPDHAVSCSDLLKYADTAMYRAKSAGKNRAWLYSQELTTEAERSITLESELRTALVNDEFEIHYQPRIELQSGQVAVVEALIRWNHPTRGLIAPDQFLPVANETDLIVDIGNWVLRKSCHAAARWKTIHGIGPVAVSVNVAERQIKCGNFHETVEAVLGESGLSAELLEIEVLEECVMITDQFASDTFAALSSLGVRMSIDDFGAGYSSLNRLKQLPFDALKIDGVFIQELTENSLDQAIVDTIITLGHNLGMRVVAERIETREQAEFLKICKCDEGQGYYFKKPLPERELLEYLSTQHTLQLPPQYLASGYGN